MRWMLLAVLMGCGGSVEVTTTDNGRVTAPPAPTSSATDAGTADTGAPDATQDATSCTCAGANNGTLICNGVQAEPAESCKACGGWCKCYVNGLGYDQACTSGEACAVNGESGVCQ